MEDLEARWKKIQIDYETVLLSPETSCSKEDKENAKLNFNISAEAYYSARSTILEVLRMSGSHNLQNVTFRNPANSLNGSHNIIDTQGPGAANICIKVPPCDTDTFSGSYEDWPSFRDMFTAVYVNHPKLTRVQKLYHLRNKTKGSAGAIVKRYTFCDTNFDLAWGALKSRYENKRVLVDNQLRLLFNIPTASTENSDCLQKIHSAVSDCLSTLKSLEVDIQSWDPILIYLKWKWKEMDTFLMNRFEVVERISSIRSTKERHSLPSVISSRPHSKIQTYTSQEKLTQKCYMCKNNHSIRICPDFQKISPQERINFVFRNKLCNNCLSESHVKAKCKSKNTCMFCKKRHHSLLHLNQLSTSKTLAQTVDNTVPVENAQPCTSSSLVVSTHEPSFSTIEGQSQVQANVSSCDGTILLRTALVQIEVRGEFFTIRALIDPGPQRTFLSERGHKHKLYSTKHNTRCSINAIVLPKLTKRLPSVTFEVPTSSKLRGLDLADPGFNVSSNIDLILGSDSESHINLEGGPIRANSIQSFTTNVMASDESMLCDILKKFWEMEEIPKIDASSIDDQCCEDYYAKTTTRQPDGRYVVRLPFNKKYNTSMWLGASRALALGQYKRMQSILFSGSWH
ncbi:uncharacterized protein LOC142236023 [Haematobia irritans]|uniref:uncharacterized protein LOC142236023 n=1 Tax=Haematobia irritans TaxID=7368 RepID=UPI003F4F8F50